MVPLRNAWWHPLIVMPCYHPIRVNILRKSAVGGRRIRDNQQVPCGNCLGCRAEQGRQWAVRMMHEAQMHQHSWFLTLTYDDDNLPENGTLVPEHFRSFVKSVRRDQPPGSVSFFGCGEYGDQRRRPHYHAVLYGVEFFDRYLHTHRSGNPVWRSETLERYWNRGLSEFSNVTMGSASYVASYVRKKVEARENEDYYIRVVPETGELVEVAPEFARMSLRPAIGRRWIERYWRDVYPSDCVVVDGVEAKPPRYYDKWLEKHQPEVAYQVRMDRWNPEYDDSRYKRAAREKIHKARINLHERKVF